MPVFYNIFFLFFFFFFFYSVRNKTSSVAACVTMITYQIRQSKMVFSLFTAWHKLKLYQPLYWRHTTIEKHAKLTLRDCNLTPH